MDPSSFFSGRRLRRALVALFPLAYVAAGLDAAPLVEGHHCTVAIRVSDATVAPGETVRVEIRVKDLPEAYGAQVNFHLETEAFRFVDGVESTGPLDARPGSLFPAERAIFLSNEFDPATRSFVYAMSLTNPAPSVTGDGLLLAFDLRAESPGECGLKFDALKFGTRDGKLIQPVIEGGDLRLTVLSPEVAQQERRRTRGIRSVVAMLVIAFCGWRLQRARRRTAPKPSSAPAAAPDPGAPAP